MTQAQVIPAKAAGFPPSSLYLSKKNIDPTKKDVSKDSRKGIDVKNKWDGKREKELTAKREEEFLSSRLTMREIPKVARREEKMEICEARKTDAPNIRKNTPTKTP
jgi:hypothetical protein